MKSFVRKILILFMLAIITLASCTFTRYVEESDRKLVEVQNFYMGTVVTQRVYGRNARKAADEIGEKLEEIERRMTINEPGGEINKLNGVSGKSSVKLSDETVYVLKTASKYSQLSDGAFDVTIGPLVKAWGIFTDAPRIPAEDEIERLLKLVNYKSLKVDEDKHSVKLEKSGQMVDLGGIAKGYAGDEAVKIFMKYGIKSAYINLGGNVVVHGSKPDGTPWRIGIQNPRDRNGKYVGIIDVVDKAVVTSGDYERYFEKDGVRYHHILDPKTGYPANSGLISATIIADKSINADALSTVTFILGLKKGKELIESLNGIEAIFITSDKGIFVTTGLKDNFRLTEESKDFRYVKEG